MLASAIVFFFLSNFLVACVHIDSPVFESTQLDWPTKRNSHAFCLSGGASVHDERIVHGSGGNKVNIIVALCIRHCFLRKLSASFREFQCMLTHLLILQTEGWRRTYIVVHRAYDTVKWERERSERFCVLLNSYLALFQVSRTRTTIPSTGERI